jgi:tryptophan-rich sensory protein
MKANFGRLALSLIGPLLIGFLGSVFTIDQIDTWYQQINKPELIPPNSVFGPVWTILYLLMGIALYLVVESKAKQEDKNRAYLIFGIQLILNLLWSIIFFTMHRLLSASAEIIILWIAIILNILSFWKVSKTASLLLIPYLLWVTFASYLTIAVWVLNR